MERSEPARALSVTLPCTYYDSAAGIKEQAVQYLKALLEVLENEAFLVPDENKEGIQFSVTTPRTHQQNGTSISPPKTSRLSIRKLIEEQPLYEDPYIRSCMATNTVPVLSLCHPSLLSTSASSFSSSSSTFLAGSSSSSQGILSPRSPRGFVPTPTPFSTGFLIHRATLLEDQDHEAHAFHDSVNACLDKWLSTNEQRSLTVLRPESLTSSMLRNYRNSIAMQKTSLVSQEAGSLPASFLVRFILPPGDFSKIIPCAMGQSVSDAIRTLFGEIGDQRSQKLRELFSEYGKADMYIAKLPGRQEYLDGTLLLHEVKHIREAIKRKRTVCLCLIEKSSLGDHINEIAPDEEPAKDFVRNNDAFELLTSSVIESNNIEYDALQVLQQWEQDTRPFSLQIMKADRLVDNLLSTFDPAIKGRKEGLQLAVRVEFFHAGKRFGERLETEWITYPALDWTQWLISTSVGLHHLPKGTVLGITLLMRRGREAPVGLAWANLPYLTHLYTLRQGRYVVYLWPEGMATPLGTCIQNRWETKKEGVITLTLDFPVYEDDYVPNYTFSQAIKEAFTPEEIAQMQFPVEGDHMATLKRIFASDSLDVLSETEKDILWTYRGYCSTKPEALPKFLSSVPWNEPDKAREALRLLAVWAPCESPIDALELLGNKFAEPAVREYAVRCLAKLSDRELSDLLAVLVQALKYELFHDSPLARFLLQRSLKNRLLLGHHLFWLLQSEINVPQIAPRFTLILSTYLQRCGVCYLLPFSYSILFSNPHFSFLLKEHREYLNRQKYLVRKLVRISDQLKMLSGPKARKKYLQAELSSLAAALPPKLLLPVDPSVRVKSLVLSECRYMDSATLPLFLVFEVEDPYVKENVSIIFKSGDDRIRQDALTLQMFRLMDKLWMEKGLDMNLTTYACVPTGITCGFIEVVCILTYLSIVVCCVLYLFLLCLVL
ncbi:Phosphatidylinositol 4,5-bisphosphate 3-kinase catalytic subunit alpha isoform, variant 2 [Balamuthia mandrillaris]